MDLAKTRAREKRLIESCEGFDELFAIRVEGEEFIPDLIPIPH